MDFRLYTKVVWSIYFKSVCWEWGFGIFLLSFIFLNYIAQEWFNSSKKQYVNVERNSFSVY